MLLVIHLLLLLDNYLKAVFINVRFLLKTFHNFVEFNLARNYILALSETWLAKHIPDGTIQINGYKGFCKDRDKKEGAVTFYLKDFSVIDEILI